MDRVELPNGGGFDLDSRYPDYLRQTIVQVAEGITFGRIVGTSHVDIKYGPSFPVNHWAVHISFRVWTTIDNLAEPEAIHVGVDFNVLELQGKNT